MTNQCQHGQLARVCLTCEQAAEIERLRAELAKHQESEYHPDWSMLAATRASLKEHQQMIRELQAEVAGLRELMRSVVTELDDDDPNGPGHAHEKPGVWDESNKRNLAGKPCKWCALWAEFKLAARKVEA